MIFSAQQQVLQGNFADGATGYFNIASFKTSKAAKQWAAHAETWTPWAKEAGAVTMTSVLLSPVTMAFWAVFPTNAAQSTFDALLSTDATIPDMFGDMTT